MIVYKFWGWGLGDYQFVEMLHSAWDMGGGVWEEPQLGAVGWFFINKIKAPLKEDQAGLVVELISLQ
jgi:hypothetical protein